MVNHVYTLRVRDHMTSFKKRCSLEVHVLGGWNVDLFFFNGDNHISCGFTKSSRGRNDVVLGSFATGLEHVPSQKLVELHHANS